MVVTVDFASEAPLYAQLRDQIVVGVASGALADGEALPSVRRMAADLGVNVNTVAKAYGLLKDAGFAAVDRRSGYSACAPPPAGPAEKGALLAGLRGRLLPAAAEAACRGVGFDEFIETCKKTFLEAGGEK